METNFGPMAPNANVPSSKAISTKVWQRARPFFAAASVLMARACSCRHRVPDVTDDMTIAREEIFGPVMAVLDFDSEKR